MCYNEYGDDMKNKLYRNSVIFCYILSFFILLYCINVIPKLIINIRIILLSIVCILIYMGGFILVNKLNYYKKILKINLIIYSLIYIITIFSLTLFDEIYGRQGLVIIDWDKDLLNNYINTSFNIIPFKTVKLFYNGYINGFVNYKDFYVNVVGNFLAFMPCGIFLPLIFKSMNKYYKFLITMIVIIVVIELLQFLTMSGSCDIDDLILNLLGASIVYFITRIKCINKFIHKIFLFE